MKRHNKKRNTAFLFETLVIELTKSIVQKDHKRKHQISEMLKTHFDQKTILRKELDLFMALLETDGLDAKTSEKLLAEAKKQYTNLDKQKIFEQQSALIKKINTTLSKSVFSNFMPNYKDLATIGQIFNDSTPIKSRVLLENKIVEKLSNKQETEQSQMQPIDNIVYKTFVDKFNDQYGTKLTEQQSTLLSYYISSFADNGLQLKTFLNEELARLKVTLTSALESNEISNDSDMMDSTNKVIAKLDEYKNTPVDKAMIEGILKTQELVREIES
tara:strand:- start:207 stop:1025 length:819 start_codon:yes stop_codon:yes gene_type:complete